MKTRFFIDKPGYWVYDTQTKQLNHHFTYPGSNIDHWIYAGSQGHVVVENDKILEFYPTQDLYDSEMNELICFHNSKEYVGFTDKFMYCTKCGVKL